MTELPAETGTRVDAPAARRELAVPELSLVVLVGISGAGKSTFARRNFRSTQVLSSDFCRGLVADDENDQAATPDAFELLSFIAAKRLAAGRLTVVDATNVRPDDRKKLVALAREYDVLPTAIVLDLPIGICAERNRARPDRDLRSHVLHRQRDALRRSLRGLEREGFRKVHVLGTVEDVDAAVVVPERMRNDLRHLTSPFDVIGDVHGCRTELEHLLDRLGYRLERDHDGRPIGAAHPDARTAVFLGDLVDRGPDTPGVLRLVMSMVAAGTAIAVPGNHENKLVRALRGRKVQVTHGLAESLEQLDAQPEDFRADVVAFLYGLVGHYVLDGGRLVVAHAGLPERYHGRASGRVRDFALYGQTTGETDEFGLPVRYAWADDYRGRATVLYGHTPVPEPVWVNNTLCLDTGCVFGGQLTALRYPERELVSVPAERVYYQPVRPLDGTGQLPARPPGPPGMAGGREPDVLDLEDVLGNRVVETRHHGRVRVREENAAAALEVMSRFALDPRWLLYLPPAMSPCATSSRPDLLEHPAEAFAEYRTAGVADVICQEKHMGSRAVAVLCRDADVARTRFGAPEGTTGVVHTRTGRPFFPPELTEELVTRLSAAVAAAGLWRDLDASWLVLDGELMPWSVKAEELLRSQYAAVGAAAGAALPAAVGVLRAAQARGLDVSELLDRTRIRAGNAELFTAAYRRYCWPTRGLAGVRFAPFQVLAVAGRTFADRDHAWHLAQLERLVRADPQMLAATRSLTVKVHEPGSKAAAIKWWEELTAAGGEGMVVKPLANLVRGPRGLVQPGVKVRGREYLRIIYGPDYAEPENLERLRQRSLGRKRSLSLREYALGLEALELAAAGEPLHRVHACVFAVLALESEPVDPRL